MPAVDSVHLLPASGAPTDRMKLHLQGVVDDTKDWVDLRVKLAMIEVEERAKQKLNPIVASVTQEGARGAAPDPDHGRRSCPHGHRRAVRTGRARPLHRVGTRASGVGRS